MAWDRGSTTRATANSFNETRYTSPAVGSDSRCLAPLSEKNSTVDNQETNVALDLPSESSVQSDKEAVLLGLKAASVTTREIGPEPDIRPPTSNTSPHNDDSPEIPENHHHGLYWRSPLTMIFLFAFGLLMAIGHHLYYNSLRGDLVGNVDGQQRALRYGTTIAYVTQVCFVTSVGIAYTQWLYKTLKNTSISVAACDAAFSADQTILALLNTEFLRKVKIGSLMALIAWLLQLPSLVTPATLFVNPGIMTSQTSALVPSMNMTNVTIAGTYQPRRFAYFVPTNGSDDPDVDSYVLLGPRTIISRLTAATATIGQILPIIPPYVNSTYHLQFYGPKVSCTDANSTVSEILDEFVVDEMAKSPPTAKEVSNAYFAFVPDLSGVRDGKTVDNGLKIPSPVLDNRLQRPANGSNEIWIVFKRYTNGGSCENPSSVESHHLACRLYNASYHVNFEFVEGNQTITDNGTQILEEVPYPRIDPSIPSDLVQHAYSGYMWALSDQLIGSMGFYTDNSSDNNVVTSFSEITTEIQHTSLLGSSDLDVFFDQNHAIYSGPNCTSTDQRLMDIRLAGNRTLNTLIEELSFNTTVSFMSNTLLSPPINTTITTMTSVNLYAYHRENLLLAYGLAVFFALLANILGGLAFRINGVSHDKLFSSFLSATRDPGLAILFHYQALGKLPVPDSIKKTLLVFGKLRFGDMVAPGLGFMRVPNEEKPRRGSRFSFV